MNNIKSVIISVITGTLGAILSMIGNLSLPLTLVVTLLMWGGGYMLSWKEPKLKSPVTDDLSVEEYLEYGKKAVSHLQYRARQIDDEQLSTKISNISFSIEKIIDSLNKNPDKFFKHRKIFSYYIPSTVSLIDRYDEIEDKELTSKNSKEFMNNVSNIINALEEAYKNMLNNIYEDDITDSSADIQVLNDILKMEGYKYE